MTSWCPAKEVAEDWIVYILSRLGSLGIFCGESVDTYYFETMLRERNLLLEALSGS